MSRTRLCVLTALGLAALSVATVLARRWALGPGWAAPHGPDTWKVAMLVRGKSSGDARLVTVGPLDSSRQHVVREALAGDDFTARPQAGAGDRRATVWTQRAG